VALGQARAEARAQAHPNPFGQGDGFSLVKGLGLGLGLGDRQVADNDLSVVAGAASPAAALGLTTGGSGRLARRAFRQTARGGAGSSTPGSKWNYSVRMIFRTACSLELAACGCSLTKYTPGASARTSFAPGFRFMISLPLMSRRHEGIEGSRD